MALPKILDKFPEQSYTYRVIWYGPVAQLGERSVRIREVKGSNPSRSIKSKTPCLLTRSFLFIQDPEGFEQYGTAAGRAINSPVGC